MIKETEWNIILVYPSSLSRKDKDYHYRGQIKERERVGDGENKHLEKNPNSLNKSLFFLYIHFLSLPVSLLKAKGSHSRRAFS